MDLYPKSETWSAAPGVFAPADGNASGNEIYQPAGGSPGAPDLSSSGDTPRYASGADDDAYGDGAAQAQTPATPYAANTSTWASPDPALLGPNNERLEDAKPELVHALRELVRQYREEGIVARRNEIRRIRQARLFWQGLQYAWWNPNDMNWHLPYENRSSDDRQLEEMPRYQFVTNFYQGFGLSFIAVLSQDVPSVRFYPQSAQSLVDISAARAASDVATLIEQNNHVEQLLTALGYFLWTDGKLGAYVRYVVDGPRFGFHDEDVLEPIEIPLGDERVTVPRVVGTRRVPNGQEVITIAGGLELNTPVWANEMHEYPYLQWQTEVHRAKLKAAYPHAAHQIESSPAQDADDVYARVSRLSVEQGLPSIQPGDALMNLITFDRTWLRPWAFFSVEDEAVRNELLAMFPEGCYVGFAGDAYCESRNESMDDHWRVLHALPGDGQNRPSVGDSLVQVQERYNVLSNMQAETYEYGIPPIYADPQVLDFDALANQVAEPAAHFPARARPGQPLAAGFFQPAPAQVPPDMLRHQQDLIGPVAQFLTGLFPAIFGGNMEDVKTASGYALARDQAMGRLGLVWRRTKQFYADVMLLSVDCFRKNRPDGAEIPLLGPDGVFDSRTIRVADLKGNICVHPEADETFPRLKSQQRGVLAGLFSNNDPIIQEALTEPANLGYIKNVLGLSELVIPGEDSRNKQLREIQQLLSSAPLVVDASQPVIREAKDPSSTAPQENAASQRDLSPSPAPRNENRAIATGNESGDEAPGGFANVESGPFSGAPKGGGAAAGSAGEFARHSPLAARHSELLPSVPVDALLDDHAVEFEECKRWANSDAGQAARMTNPPGFANVRAHAEAHLRVLQARQAAVLNPAPITPSPVAQRSSRVNPAPPAAELHTSSPIGRNSHA